MENLPSQQTGQQLHIMTDSAFNCDGMVAVWELYSIKIGTIFTTVWRPINGGETYRLIGKDEITFASTGYHKISISLEDRIAVQVGDVLGMHYSECCSPQAGLLPKMRPIELCCGYTSTDTMPSFIKWQIADTEVPIGTELLAATGDSTSDGGKRLLPLRPLSIVGKTTPLYNIRDLWLDP